MHDLMFAEQSALGEDALKEKAKRLGLDSKSFDECLAGGKAREAVQKDVDAAEQLGIGGTPFSFVNGRYVDGAASAQDLSALIDDELRRAGPSKAAPAVRR
jgi:protein-disulfide isomerase